MLDTNTKLLKVQHLQFKLTLDSWTTIYLVGTVTQEAIQKFIDILTLSKDTYPTQEELDAKNNVPERETETSDV